MVDAVRTVASMDVELTVEERNLLSVAYKNLIGKNRNAWRILGAISKGENSSIEPILSDYLQQIETELKKDCDEIIHLVDSHLLPSATTAEAKVFFFKLKADYYRYVAEITEGSNRHDTAEQSLLAYKNGDLSLSYIFKIRMFPFQQVTWQLQNFLPLTQYD